MRALTLESFNELMSCSTLKPKFTRELRFVKSTAQLEDWSEYELFAITERSDTKGVLLIEINNQCYALPYELKRGLTSSTGKAQAVICDFCRTWQTGSRSGSITFTATKKNSNISFLCCADLQCSQHVRNKTSAAKTSRSQLREDLSSEQRIERLNERLATILASMNIEPIPE